MTISSKTVSIINRFPDFYNPEDQTSLLYLFVDVFAEILEEAETDLLQVMRSHHVDTANNFGSQGIDARQKGDLDKIFTLYLEKLGGTSQLIQVNQDLKVTDIKEVSAFVTKLTQQSDSLSDYIWSNLPEEVKTLLNQYHVSNTQFAPYDFLELTSLVIKLIVAKDLLTLHLQTKFSEETRNLLQAYDGSENLLVKLRSHLIEDFNTHILGDRQLYKKCQEHSIQINLALKLKPWLNNSSDNQPQQNAITNSLGQILRRKLSIELQNPLYRETEQKLTNEFWEKVLSELKQNLSKVTLCQQLWNAIEEIEQNPPPTDIQPSKEFNSLLKNTAQAFQQIFAVTQETQLQKPLLPEQVKSLLNESRTKDDIKRLNRIILETVYPEQIRRSQIPQATEVIETLVKALNEQILPQSDFYHQNQEYFNQLMLDLETKKLIAKQESLTDNQLQRLNRLLLETAYPLSIRKSYDPYRERLKALIKVLRRGAATKEGIRDIVAANLGIFDDDPEAREAKKQIVIQEYAAEAQPITFTWVYPSSETPAESENMTKPPWSVPNPNPIPTTPNYIRVHLQKVESKVSNSENKAPAYLIKPRLVRSLRLNTIPIIWLLLRQYNCMAGILFLRKSLSIVAGEKSGQIHFLRLEGGDQQ